MQTFFGYDVGVPRSLRTRHIQFANAKLGLCFIYRTDISFCLFDCLFVCLFVRLFVCSFVCLFACLLVCVFACSFWEG